MTGNVRNKTKLDCETQIQQAKILTAITVYILDEIRYLWLSVCLSCSIKKTGRSLGRVFCGGCSFCLGVWCCFLREKGLKGEYVLSEWGYFIDTFCELVWF